MRGRHVSLLTATILILGFGLVVVLGGAGYLPGCDEEDDVKKTLGEGGPSPRVPWAGTPDRPRLEFPPQARCENEAVNKFMEDFYQVCYLGQYDKFRLMMSSRVDPFPPDRFKRAVTAIEFVRIESIDKLPDVEDVPPPIYLVQSRVQLRPDVKVDEKEKIIAIVVFKEAGRWVMAPAPKELREELEAFFEFDESAVEEGGLDTESAPPERDASAGPSRAGGG